MRGYAMAASVGLLMMGLLAMPNLSPATDGSSNRDGNARHSLLKADLRSKIEHIRDKIEDRREHDHNNNQGGSSGSLTALQAEVTNLKSALATANAQLVGLTGRLSALEQKGASGGSVDPVLVDLAKYVKVVTSDMNGVKGPHVVFHHANVHVQSGSGTTAEASALTGLGNLIVGYNETPTLQGWSRAGSHNFIVGPSHSFSSAGGAVLGTNNLISGQYATVLGGNQNRAQGPTSSILGGYGLVVNGTEETYP